MIDVALFDSITCDENLFCLFLPGHPIIKSLACFQKPTYRDDKPFVRWKMDHLKMYLLLEMVVFHAYVSLPEGIYSPG